MKQLIQSIQTASIFLFGLIQTFCTSFRFSVHKYPSLMLHRTWLRTAKHLTAQRGSGDRTTAHLEDNCYQLNHRHFYCGSWKVWRVYMPTSDSLSVISYPRPFTRDQVPRSLMRHGSLDKYTDGALIIEMNEACCFFPPVSVFMCNRACSDAHREVVYESQSLPVNKMSISDTKLTPRAYIVILNFVINFLSGSLVVKYWQRISVFATTFTSKFSCFYPRRPWMALLAL